MNKPVTQTRINGLAVVTTQFSALKPNYVLSSVILTFISSHLNAAFNENFLNFRFKSKMFLFAITKIIFFSALAN